ncbi:glycine cleavage system H protein-like [Bolinopsis microptera]|uniref:glycine cleavage system H protein-like n=1 Tax=Bolinopsis microptera TaxID=2820187 RepID=UPI003079A6DA
MALRLTSRVCLRQLYAQRRCLSMYFTEAHEWVKVEGNKFRIGITDHAQAALGDVVFVELPELDSELDAGEEIGSVESVKAVGDVHCPVGGIVQAVNEQLLDKPGMINSSPEDEGWIAELELTDSSELDDLMDRDGYAAFLADGA